MERWNLLKTKALDISDKLRFIDMASEQLDSACVDMVELTNAKSLSEARYQAIGIIYKLGQTISLLNGVPIKRGRGKLKAEILAMPVVPEHFEELYDTAFFCSDKDKIILSFAVLMENTRKLVESERHKHTPLRSFKDKWSNLYEELINAYNKVVHACEINDPVTMLFAVVELTYEIEQTTKHTSVTLDSLPDLIEAYDPNNLTKIYKLAKVHQEDLENLLDRQDVSVRRFCDFNELEKYLEGI